VRLALGPAEVCFTERSDGDFGVHAVDTREPRMRTIVDRPWKTAKQVHGATIAVVDVNTASVGEADAILTRDPAVAVAIRVADCAPIVLASRDGMIGVVHAGWRGLVAGVVEGAVSAMSGAGAGDIEATIGPCIHAECYEFGNADLAVVADRYGDGVRGHTATGKPALDVVAGASAALEHAGVKTIEVVDSCTACDGERWFSHRARNEVERIAAVAWLP
jgi:YfiH family protein